MGTRVNKENESANNVNDVLVSNITISDVYLTKYNNNIVVQTNGVFEGVNADNTIDKAKGNFLIAPMRLLKESSKDMNVSLLYSLVSKQTPKEILLSLIKLILLNSTINIKRTFVPTVILLIFFCTFRHTEIVACSNTRDVMSVLPIIQMQLANAQKAVQSTNILNAFNI